MTTLRVFLCMAAVAIPSLAMQESEKVHIPTPSEKAQEYARVEMAQALLERAHENWMTTLRDTKK